MLFFSPPFRQLPQLAFAVALVTSACAGSPYGQLALRSNLSPLPYMATEGGREGKRFANEEVNRYHLYDFYRRQAAYELSTPSPSGATLPPFPGLDGGRVGHWGVTNEKDTGAYIRSTAPDFGPVTGRKGAGELFQLTGNREDPGVIVFDSVRGGLKAAFLQARLAVPEHPFGLAVDRFGFALEVRGNPSFQADTHEWSRAGKPIARFAGHHIRGDAAVFQWELGTAAMLDMPVISATTEGAPHCLVRNFEILSNVTESLDFLLPIPAGESEGKAGNAALSRESEGTVMVRQSYGDHLVLHRIISADGLTCEPSSDGGKLTILNAPAHGRLVIGSWVGSLTEETTGRAALEKAVESAKNSKPSVLIKEKGTPRFPATLTVSGRLNADPEASGTSYEVDDIPVPSDNPNRAPMTLSGIAFDKDGTAYICTLVGDVWKVTGLEGNLDRVVWKRFATGLDLPMGITMVEGVPYVNVRRHILALRDSDADGEADFYERFNRVDLPTADECGRDLSRDSAGNFTFNTKAAIYRLSADGTELTKIGHGARNPLGLAVRQDGLTLSDSSEGNEGNGTCSIYESEHSENASSVSKSRKILYLPRGVDNSPGSRLFMDEPRFGPLGNAILGTSYGAGTWYYLLRDAAESTPQAALVPMPGSFSGGACRIAVQPRDGQVFVAGLDGWGDYAVTEGCLHRLRYTGKKATRLSGWNACRNGIVLHFDRELAATIPPANAFFIQQWNYVNSRSTYGSAEYSVRTPDTIGHDRVSVTSVVLSPDRRSLFLETPAILPAMCTQVSGALHDATGAAIPLELYATLNQLRPDSAMGSASDPGKAASLEVPEKDQNGDTYQNIVGYFDRLAGRNVAQRTAAPEVPYRKEELNYPWIRENLVNRQCMPCHGPGTQHDLTSYEGMMRKINLKDPEKSALHGMISTNSMPPYPLPEVAPGMRLALIEWIKAGAPQ